MKKQKIAMIVVGALAVVATAAIVGAVAANANDSHSAASSPSTPSNQAVSPSPSSPAVSSPTPTTTQRASTPQPIRTPITVADIWSTAAGSYKGFVLNPQYLPTPGSYLDKIGAAGTIGEYLAPSGQSILLGAAPGAFPQIEAQIAATSTSVSGFGPPNKVQVYQVNGGGTRTGDYEVFAPGYWFSMTSVLFTNNQQAVAPLIQAALQAIPSD
jgi:hypothetical protein